MKESSKLIIHHIRSLSGKFPFMSFKYGFDVASNQHIIDVAPMEGYNEKIYASEEVTIIKDFLCKFPEEGIVFVTENPYLRVKKPLFNTGQTFTEKPQFI